MSYHLDKYVIGYRIWRVNIKDNTLLPSGLGASCWDKDKEIRADCKTALPYWSYGYLSSYSVNNEHKAPDHNCSCGLHAYYDIKSVTQRGSVTNCVGVVRARGAIELHRSGFRAEFMQPIALGYYPELFVTKELNKFFFGSEIIKTYEEALSHEEHMKEVARVNNLACMPIVQLRSYAAEFGIEIPSVLYSDLNEND